MHATARVGADIPRAWIDDALDQWHRESQGYGPDPDAPAPSEEYLDALREELAAEPRPDDDDTQEIDCPIVWPEEDGDPD